MSYAYIRHYTAQVHATYGGPPVKKGSDHTERCLSPQREGVIAPLTRSHGSVTIVRDHRPPRFTAESAGLAKARETVR